MLLYLTHIKYMLEYLSDWGILWSQPPNVHRTGSLYIFECDKHRNVDGLILHHIVIIDGRVITFRRGHWTIVPQEHNTSPSTLLGFGLG